jgi:hypothetical protein
MYRRFIALMLPVLALLAIAAGPRPAPALQQCANVLISAPRSGTTVRGDVEVLGSASIDRFQFYKVEFSPLNNPDAWSAVSQVIQRPVVNGRLDVWNSRTVPDGLYNLKLTVVDERAQELCRSVVTQLQVANRAPVPTETPVATETPEASPTPAMSPTPGITPTPTVSATVPPLPTVPPPPTQPPPATAASVAQPAATSAPAGQTIAPGGTGTPAATPTRSSSSFLPDFSGIQRSFNTAFDFTRLRDAFLLGAVGTVAIFTFIGLVMLLRRLL